MPAKGIGADRPTHGDVSVPAGTGGLAAVRDRLARLAHASHAAALDEARLAGLAGKVLELRRLANIARDRMIAALPSLNPVDGSIVDGFGYRLRPVAGVPQRRRPRRRLRRAGPRRRGRRHRLCRLGRRVRDQGRHRPRERLSHLVRASLARRGQRPASTCARGRRSRRSVPRAKRPGRTYTTK